MDSQKRCLYRLCKNLMIPIPNCLTRRLAKDYFLSHIKRAQEISWYLIILAVRVICTLLSQFKLKINQLHLKMMLLLETNSPLQRRPLWIREICIHHSIITPVMSTGLNLLKLGTILLAVLSHLLSKNSLL